MVGELAYFRDDPEKLNDQIALIHAIPVVGRGNTVEKAISDLKNQITARIKSIGLEAVQKEVQPNIQANYVTTWTLEQLNAQSNKVN